MSGTYHFMMDTGPPAFVMNECFSSECWWTHRCRGTVRRKSDFDLDQDSDSMWIPTRLSSHGWFGEIALINLG